MVALNARLDLIPVSVIKEIQVDWCQADSGPFACVNPVMQTMDFHNIRFYLSTTPMPKSRKIPLCLTGNASSKRW